MLYYGARWYDSSLGRFAQADSIVPGGVQGYDRYAYSFNNPIRYNDPTGHCPVCILPAIGVVEVLTIAVATFVVAEVALNPELHQATMESISNTMENVAELADSTKNQKAQRNLSQTGYPADDPDGRGPWQINCSGTTSALACIIGGVTIAKLVLEAATCGSEDCINSTDKESLDNNITPSTPTATNTPNLSCAVYKQCSSPS